METNKMLRDEISILSERIEALLNEQKRLYSDKAKLIERLRGDEWLLKYLDIVIKIADIPDEKWLEADSQLLHDIRMKVVEFKKKVYNV